MELAHSPKYIFKNNVFDELKNSINTDPTILHATSSKHHSAEQHSAYTLNNANVLVSIVDILLFY